MKAMIFAAGLGTRLRPLTDNMPKALVPVAGVPMLERVINNLKRYGFDDITINVHHFGEQIIDFVASHDNFGVNIHISDERDLLLDTGGGILKARKFLDGDKPFLVHNADILTDINLKDLYDAHVSDPCQPNATLLASDRNSSRKLYFNINRRLCGWKNENTGETKPASFAPLSSMQALAFSGIHVISPNVFNALAKYATEPKFSITPFYLAFCNELLFKGYTPSQPFHWFDIGKPETLQKAIEWLEEK